MIHNSPRLRSDKKTNYGRHTDETVVESTNPLLIVELEVHDDDEGIGCAEGVVGSPCMKVETAPLASV